MISASLNRMNEALIIVVCCIAVVSTQTTDTTQSTEKNIYCDPGFSCDGHRHTLCQYGDPRASSSCKSIEPKKLDYGDRKWILGAHNGMRNLMAKGEVPDAPVGWPQAANMRQLRWDEDLAECAAKWARQCKPGSDKCRSTNYISTDLVQQNEYGPAAAKERPNWKNVIKGWFNQMLTADVASVKSFKRDGKTKAFFLMMWWEVELVGCGLAHYSVKSKQCKKYKNKKCKEYYKHFGIKFVCNYAATEMKAGTPVWEVGPPCSKCPIWVNILDGSAYQTNCSTEKKSSYKYLCALPGLDDHFEEPVLLPLTAPQRSQVGVAFLLILELVVYACSY